MRAGATDMTRATPAQSSRPVPTITSLTTDSAVSRPEHAEGRVDEGVLLVVAGVRGVVGGDGVDGAVGQGGAQGVDVLLGPQRRVDLVGRVVAGEQVGGQHAGGAA